MKLERIDPIQIENYVDDDFVKDVYSTVYAAMEEGIKTSGDKYGKMFRFESNGFITLNSGWSKNVEDTIRSIGKELSNGDFDFNRVTIIFARYTKESGSHPMLLPHLDVVSNQKIYTSTIRLKSTFDWDFYVKDQKFDMPSEKSAVCFIGNTDCHWRPDAPDLTPDDYYDILLCQTWPSENNDEFDISHKEWADKTKKEYAQKYHHLTEKSQELMRILNENITMQNTDCTGESEGESHQDAYDIAYGRKERKLKD